ncbi:hypothetical protein AAZX31_02G271000 [Glycine max]
MMQEVTENIIDACGQRKRQIILFLSNLILISHFGLVSFASCLASNSNTQMQFSLLILPLTHESSSYRIGNYEVTYCDLLIFIPKMNKASVRLRIRFKGIILLKSFPVC